MISQSLSVLPYIYDRLTAHLALSVQPSSTPRAPVLL